MKVIIISAIAQNKVIGRSNGEMPWHVKEEFQHFKKTTLGSPVIMGRKTFETLGKPLKGRENIIITRNSNFQLNFKEVKIFHSIQDSIKYCELKNYDKAFIIGGGQIYKQALPLADEMILSYMKFEAEGDIFFPEYKKDNWEKISTEDLKQFEIVTYIKKNGKTN
ncbi:MAG: dihydrofolate reductase [Ignavibacteriaceae bacterium]|nr:dihydrofolate reductase [Ignavibacteriaceae bacterium]MCW9095898.1 dihydrofolate reductase [Ignavibacteriaceae bacterium]